MARKEWSEVTLGDVQNYLGLEGFQIIKTGDGVVLDLGIRTTTHPTITDALIDLGETVARAIEMIGENVEVEPAWLRMGVEAGMNKHQTIRAWQYANAVAGYLSGPIPIDPEVVYRQTLETLASIIQKQKEAAGEK